MHTVHTVAELHEVLRPHRDKREYVVLVPTMGNLHAGHASLVQKARAVGECVVASVFVNPLQFGPSEDFDRYPRTLEADATMLQREGAHVLFAPSVRDLYPGGFPPATKVLVDSPLTAMLCGPLRPGHFMGVATVVNILFNLVQPNAAVFGEKDYQQLAVIRRMTADLGLPIRIVAAPTVREPDGLAMSTRNQYLSADERRRATEIHATLSWIAQEIEGGRRDLPALQREGLARLTRGGCSPQYLEIHRQDLSQATETTNDFVVATAAHVGRTRLIDNVLVRAGAG